MPTLERMVGGGFDNLRNVPMAAVLNTTFLQCRTSPDRLYLISDQVEVTPVKRSQLDRSANFYEHFEDYFKSKAESINLEAGLSYQSIGISGSFSAQHQEMKNKFFKEKSSLLHTSLSYHAYTVISQPGTGLHPTFKARLFAINDAISKNLTRMAHYLAQITITDFGTHVITQADVGATISQEDFVDLKANFSQTSSLNELKAAASASFLNIFKLAGISAGITVNQTAKEQFSSSLRHSQIRTQGGPDVNRLLSAASGNNFSQATLLVDDLVSLDRSGVPLFTVIIGENLVELPQSNVQQIRYLIKNATEEYYLRNTRRGCMDPSAQNFDFQANFNDSSCDQQYNNYTFGGIFQTCEALQEANSSFRPSAGERCNGLTQVNGATGSISCPENYEPANLFEVVHQFPDRHEHYCTKICRDCWVFGTCCKNSCMDIVHQDKVVLKAYWCNATTAEQIPSGQGYLFGGLYAKDQTNPFTGSPGCPGHFQANHFGLDLTVCLSRDYQLDKRNSIKFGGFFSCQTPSVLARCPKGYSQHLATIVENCEVYYCVRPEAFTNYNMPKAVRPPYDDTSALISSETGSVIYTYLDNKRLSKFSVRDALLEMASIEKSSSYMRDSVLMSQPTQIFSELIDQLGSFC
uniref:Macrophage-expressed gene 1 protein n=1 Tax=Plectus sambesii TaxID=2011161 RepID=A0A914XJ51_9BILA